MKLKVNDLYDLNAGLADLLDKELSTATAFKVQKNYNKLMDELKPSDEVRKQILEKYKQEAFEDGTVRINPDKVGDYRKENDELMNQEVDVDLQALGLSQLGESAKPRTLALLDKIIEEDK